MSSIVAPEGSKGLHIGLKQIMGDDRMKTREHFIGCFHFIGVW